MADDNTSPSVKPGDIVCLPGIGDADVISVHADVHEARRLADHKQRTHWQKYGNHYIVVRKHIDASTRRDFE